MELLIHSQTVEVWEWICNFIPHFMIDVITYSCRRLDITQSNDDQDTWRRVWRHSTPISSYSPNKIWRPISVGCEFQWYENKKWSVSQKGVWKCHINYPCFTLSPMCNLISIKLWDLIWHEAPFCLDDIVVNQITENAWIMFYIICSRAGPGGNIILWTSQLNNCTVEWLNTHRFLQPLIFFP